MKMERDRRNTVVLDWNRKYRCEITDLLQRYLDIHTDADMCKYVFDVHISV